MKVYGSFQNFDFPRIGRGFDADWTRIRRGFDADSTRIRRGFDADWTRIRRGFDADSTRILDCAQIVHKLYADRTRIGRGFQKRKLFIDERRSRAVRSYASGEHAPG